MCRVDGSEFSWTDILQDPRASNPPWHPLCEPAVPEQKGRHRFFSGETNPELTLVEHCLNKRWIKLNLGNYARNATGSIPYSQHFLRLLVVKHSCWRCTQPPKIRTTKQNLNCLKDVNAYEFQFWSQEGSLPPAQYPEALRSACSRYRRSEAVTATDDGNAQKCMYGSAISWKLDWRLCATLVEPSDFQQVPRPDWSFGIANAVLIECQRLEFQLRVIDVIIWLSCPNMSNLHGYHSKNLALAQLVLGAVPCRGLCLRLMDPSLVRPPGEVERYRSPK